MTNREQIEKEFIAKYGYSPADTDSIPFKDAVDFAAHVSNKEIDRLQKLVNEMRIIALPVIEAHSTNARRELFLNAINDAATQIVYVTDPSQLEPGKEYWLVGKDGTDPIISVCKVTEGDVYFEARIWAYEGNNQAMDRWDIFGPLAPRSYPDFEDIKRRLQR